MTNKLTKYVSNVFNPLGELLNKGSVVMHAVHILPSATVVNSLPRGERPSLDRDVRWENSPDMEDKLSFLPKTVKTGIQYVGAATGLAIIAYGYHEGIDQWGQAVLALPVVTNALSALYERKQFRKKQAKEIKQAEKTLEDSVATIPNVAESLARVSRRLGK